MRLDRAKLDELASRGATIVHITPPPPPIESRIDDLADAMSELRETARSAEAAAQSAISAVDRIEAALDAHKTAMTTELSALSRQIASYQQTAPVAPNVVVHLPTQDDLQAAKQASIEAAAAADATRLMSERIMSALSAKRPEKQAGTKVTGAAAPAFRFVMSRDAYGRLTDVVAEPIEPSTKG